MQARALPRAAPSRWPPGGGAKTGHLVARLAEALANRDGLAQHQVRVCLYAPGVRQQRDPHVGRRPRVLHQARCSPARGGVVVGPERGGSPKRAATSQCPSVTKIVSGNQAPALPDGGTVSGIGGSAGETRDGIQLSAPTAGGRAFLRCLSVHRRARQGQHTRRWMWTTTRSLSPPWRLLQPPSTARGATDTRRPCLVGGPGVRPGSAFVVEYRAAGTGRQTDARGERWNAQAMKCVPEGPEEARHGVQGSGA